ncbi:DNA polymerase III subunit alpha [Rhodococcus sp. BP-349]|uniref:DNA polymerase III subunit alpha n=1 Tax=unclassified Rhodococcus (in: high G+C Gram-positive bacteria) TaxID=192944 RepID=UPI001C9B9696|nr:DNA polymerase III subunit alpha [Rhodococcus sp. BP-363]MBY6545202.1 DNA polymerase III subunit alpha [Rhodococcus sp. BP-369]MBY6564432.1 DNA polymerase III subunit alpha [Rhodococcus sp. BP-370]MBY6578631.1 DNA polymerase III subunit alpha [Rhodococcus sp. BP-364]MBY6587932.1 DNA polymerase III subunit alpha [Rhodococcus sp. BP-358]MBY6592269.1 DNA polymerase III subunit alpha [Rhodococcus sp. BP-362]MBY6596699.1 DNA polymerase III subunit alpha [Rhodococcus sp. BP-359]MBY6601038.1 DNA
MLSARRPRVAPVSDFVHLHNHTEYSMLDGAAKIAPMFAEAQRLGMSAVGMTDHGNMYGASEFYNEAKKAGVKPIIGIEAYVAPESRFTKKRVLWGDRSQKSDDVSGSGAYTHMTMVAENATGLRNLFKLSSLASTEGQLGKWARMDEEIIANHAEGIIATTGCPSGEIQTRLRLGHEREALEAAAKWQEIWGPDNFFLELMDHGLSIERRVREGLLSIGQQLGIPPLATNDCHYVTKDASVNHEALLCIQTGKTLSDPTRFKFDGDGYYLKSAEEMRALWDDEVPGACDSTLLIAERVQSYDEVWEHRDRMPVFPVPEGYTQGTWLRKEVMDGLHRRFPDGPTEEYLSRADYEISVILEMGFPAYFLVVGDLINHAKEVGIRVGPGRGSAAGSLVAYAMGITNIDPLPHGLLFERFLNPERVSMPDIDIDFDDRRRGEMVRYATEKWGSDRVAQVITFGTIKTKAAIKDSARVQFGQPGFAIADQITKALPPPVMAKDISVAGITDPTHERYKEATEVRSLIDSNPDVAKIYQTAKGLEGLIRNAGVHACAVIMSSEPLTDAIPVWKRPQDGAIITGWDYPSCEAIGLLKMDFLGLRNLTVIGDAIDNIKANRGIDIDLDALPLDDPATFELLSRGDTLGVFQLDGSAMRDLLRKMQPTGFEDIVAVLALYRPGPMGMNSHNDYADRKNGRQEVKPIHAELEEPLKVILGETYGLVVYQEQIMQLAQKVAGYSLGQADLLRRAMGKKKLSELEKAYAGFRQGMLDNDFSEAAIKALWDTVLPFAGYAFNKSHSAGYGLVSYWTAYLKANYPAEYMAGLLTSVGDDKDKAAIYLADCRRLGITVLPPDVNESELNFASVGEDIRFGMGAVRNVGANVVASIIAARKEKGKFTDFSDYLAKIDATACNKKVTESLVKAGGFDSLDHPRKGLMLIHADAIDSVLGTKKAEAIGQFDLFGGVDADESITSVFNVKIPAEEWDSKHRLALEREMLGLYVSGHPLNGVEHVLAAQSDTAIPTILEGSLKDGTQVTVGGILASVNRRVNKNGLTWASAQLEDLTGGIEVLFFPQAYSVFGADVAEDAVVLVKARVSARDDRISLIANDIAVPDLSSVGVAKPVAVSLPTRQCTADKVGALKRVLASHPGTTDVHLRLISGDRVTMLKVDEKLRVTPSSALMGDLKALLGPGCLTV